MTDERPPEPRSAGPRRTNGRLLRKYLGLFAIVASATLVGNGAIEAWFFYREQTMAISRIQVEQALAGAAAISQFVSEVQNELGWTTQIPWAAGPLDQRRFDARRLLRQVPAITELTEVDATGRERMTVSRLGMDSMAGGTDVSAEAKFTEALRRKVYYGPVYMRRGSEPYMTLAVAGQRSDAGVSIAEVNLKFIWDVVSRIKVGKGGRAFVVDGDGRLIAHPDITLVLKGASLSDHPEVQHARSELEADPSPGAGIFNGVETAPMMSAYAPIVPLGWILLVELPLSEAYAPVYRSLLRSSGFLLVALCGAVLAGLVLARRMVIPIRALQVGAERIGEGDLGYQVDVRTGDEVEGLAHAFNAMSTELRDAKTREDRMARLRRFLSPQVAEVIESSGNEALLQSHRRDIAVVFCDLRGFTAFAEAAAPEEVMSVLGEYHAALGALIHEYEATLERFIGDGVMVWFNDPLPCPNPCERAVRMALAMQASIGTQSGTWRKAGHRLGFGVGITYGYATLGRIGFEGRFDYSAIGSVVNLAARLCSEARDSQILVDSKVLNAVQAEIEYETLGEFALKGIRVPVEVYNVIRLKGPQPVAFAAGGG